MSTNLHRATALNLVWAARVDDDTPHPDSREVLAAVGLVDPDEPAVITPSDERPVSLDDRGSRVPRLDASPAVTRPDPKLDRRRFVPPGLRDLPPEQPKPAKKHPVTKRAEGDGPPVKRPVKPTPAAAPRKTPPAAKKPRRRKGQRGPIHHGEPRGYAAHYKRGELPVCQPCKDAYNARQKETSALRRARIAVEKAKRDGPARIAVELDVWFADAQRSESPRVQRASAVAVSALMALRIAMDDLARAERHAAACATTNEGVA